MSESSSSSSNSSGGGCFGCLSVVAFFFVAWAILASVPTPWGIVELDLFPPAMRIIPEQSPLDTNPEETPK